MEFDKEQIRHTLSVILHAQDETIAAEMLDIARVEITHAGADFGADFYSLDLRIPAARFAVLEATLAKVEKKIEDKLGKLGIGTENDRINTVNIYPEFVVGSGAIAVPMPTKTEENRIWKPNRIRLFLSHQALKGDINKLSLAAPQIADMVAKQESFRPQLTDSLVDAVCQSMSFQQAKDGMRLLNTLAQRLTEAQIVRLLEAARDNSQVREAHGVPTQITRMAAKRGFSLPKRAEADDEFDDDIPF